jgi:hypothetical protein
MKSIKNIVVAVSLTLTITSTAFAGVIPTGKSGNMPTGRTLVESVVLELLSIVY